MTTKPEPLDSDFPNPPQSGYAPSVSEPSYPRPYGAYMLLEHLGRGGMAEVELARRTVDDARFVRFVVIKRIQPKHADDRAFVRMFQDEARINAELQQENIAQVYDFGQLGEEYFLAMEYVPGVHLRHVQRLLATRGQVPPFRVTFRVLADVLAALQYAHARVDTYGRPMRLVHRDVNPRNVMMSVRGEVKLIDFGVAKADIRAENTVGKSMKGKFAYMAPEQIEIGPEVDGRADLFAVGLVMHELIEGRSPYAGMNEAQILQATLASQIPPLKVPAMFPDSALLRAIHDKALARSPEERYLDAASMREDIVKAADLVGGLATREEMAEFLRKIDPTEVSRITERLKTYRSLNVSEVTTLPPKPEPSPPTPPPAPPAEDDVVDVTAAEAPPSNPPSLPPPAPPPRQVVEEPRSGIRLALGVGLGAAIVFFIGVMWGFNRKPAEGSAPLAAVAAPVVAPVAAPSAPPSVSAPPVAPEGPTATPATPEATGTATPAATGGSGGSADRGSKSRKATSNAAVSAPPVETPAATPAPEAAPTGYLSVTSAPQRGYEVYVDGRIIGYTPLRNHNVPSGAYTVTVRDPVTGRTWSRDASVEAGRTALVTVQP